MWQETSADKHFTAGRHPAVSAIYDGMEKHSVNSQVSTSGIKIWHHHALIARARGRCTRKRCSRMEREDEEQEEDGKKEEEEVEKGNISFLQNTRITSTQHRLRWLTVRPHCCQGKEHWLL